MELIKKRDGMKYIKRTILLLCLFIVGLDARNYAVVEKQETKHATQAQKKHLFQSVGCELMHDMLIQDSKIMQDVYKTSYYKENKQALDAWSKKYAQCVRAKKLAALTLLISSNVPLSIAFASTCKALKVLSFLSPVLYLVN